MPGVMLLGEKVFVEIEVVALKRGVGSRQRSTKGSII